MDYFKKIIDPTPGKRFTCRMVACLNGIKSDEHQCFIAKIKWKNDNIPKLRTAKLRTSHRKTISVDKDFGSFLGPI